MAGLTLGNYESTGKKKSVGITHASVYLKPALVQVAHAAMKSDKSPYYKQKYERIMKHRDKKRAIIALAWMLLTAIYHMLSTGEVWNPTDLYKGYSQVAVNGYKSYLNRMKKYILSLLEPMYTENIAHKYMENTVPYLPIGASSKKHIWISIQRFNNYLSGRPMYFEKIKVHKCLHGFFGTLYFLGRI